MGDSRPGCARRQSFSRWCCSTRSRVSTLPSRTQRPPETLHRPLDQILDLNVRDGLVYYRALRSDRGRLDRYIASLNVVPDAYERWSREQKMAFWLNAYNAFVLQTVIDHYPIKGSSKTYPLEQRSTDSWCIRAGETPCGGSQSHARRHREDRPAASSTIRGCTSPWAAVRSAAAVFAVKPTQAIG